MQRAASRCAGIVVLLTLLAGAAAAVEDAVEPAAPASETKQVPQVNSVSDLGPTEPGGAIPSLDEPPALPPEDSASPERQMEAKETGKSLSFLGVCVVAGLVVFGILAIVLRWLRERAA